MKARNAMVVAALLAVLGALLGAVISARQPDTYKASSQLSVAATDPQGLLQGITMTDESPANVATLVTTHPVLQRAFGAKWEERKSQVSATVAPTGRFVTLEVAGNSPEQAASSLAALTNALRQLMTAELTQATAGALQAGLFNTKPLSVEVARARASTLVASQPPITSYSVSSPVSAKRSPIVMVLTGMALGSVLAAMLITLMFMWPGRVRDAAQARRRWGLGVAELPSRSPESLRSLVSGSARGFVPMVLFTSPAQQSALLPRDAEPGFPWALVDAAQPRAVASDAPVVLVVDTPARQADVDGWLQTARRFGRPDMLAMVGKQAG